MSNLDAIVVPSARTSEHLEYAAQLAQQTNAQLVVLCSGHATANNVPGLGINIRSPYFHELTTGFATDACPQALFGRYHNDISLKRNLGLLLARLMNWKVILFLDDDITYIDGINRALHQMHSVGAAGFLTVDFPDNSVVRHAERLSGLEPGVHPSAGALMVYLPSVLGFFPRIYNEDWFFLHDLWDSTGVKIAGTARQQTYNPFQDSRRSASEEFGDVLAEGIQELRKAGTRCLEATNSDWQTILTQRAKLIKDLSYKLRVREDEPNVQAALRSLHMATLCLETFTSQQYVEYIAAWRQDVNLWQERLSALPTMLSFDEALQYMGLVSYPWAVVR